MEKNWWKEAVIYQIYPRSFQDSNGDGIGDLNGIIQKLDYLQYLGIDAIWLSPVYQSPNVDNGYDISDYKAIDPEYGTMADMDRLINEADKRSIKIIMDLVINHTSSEHFWFQEALKSKENPYHDYYIWRTSNNSEPPNSLKADSGSAWEYVPELGEYYLHLHSKEQPDLNWKNPEMKEAIWEMINYWLEKEIGGFRLDVIDLIGKEPDELITKNGPELHPLINELNQQTFGNYNVVTVGETWGATPEIAKLYSKPERNELSMVFQFEHINLDKQAGKRKWDLKELDPQELHQVFVKWQTQLKQEGWNSLFWNNHDLPRIISRWGDDSEQYRELSGKMLAIYLYFMAGTPYIYQGEEIGMTNYEISDISEVNDIESRQMYEDRINRGFSKEEVLRSINAKGRDNARHPMQWNNMANAGFTTGSPWLAVNSNHEYINVEEELNRQNSLFFTYKKLIELRKEHFPVINGGHKLLDTDNPNVLAYQRYDGNEQIVIVVNFSKYQQSYNLQIDRKYFNCLIHNYGNEVINSDTLKPYEAFAVKAPIEK